jgi:hypothetical protein
LATQEGEEVVMRCCSVKEVEVRPYIVSGLAGLVLGVGPMSAIKVAVAVADQDKIFARTVLDKDLGFITAANISYQDGAWSFSPVQRDDRTDEVLVHWVLKSKTARPGPKISMVGNVGLVTVVAFVLGHNMSGGLTHEVLAILKPGAVLHGSRHGEGETHDITVSYLGAGSQLQVTAV